jgi:hypothetical protein
MNLAAYYFGLVGASHKATARLQIALRSMEYDTEKWRDWCDEMRGKCRHLPGTLGVKVYGVWDEMVEEYCGDELW